MFHKDGVTLICFYGEISVFSQVKFISISAVKFPLFSFIYLDVHFARLEEFDRLETFIYSFSSVTLITRGVYTLRWDRHIILGPHSIMYHCRDLACGSLSAWI